ncbi:hypothetical protein [Marinibacterium profundimaris]|uniref:N-acetyltransferase domain-containing protein n=1 Tax=Marinibacterium profundimaris TaxID=1679460 RepID=A0A225NFJ3_9RHOB|nr:hypothetical protein [Marinibacterium profundimaris]OWU72228.1 hypothetical protein ATO3_16800 [Marinibacterium profundimaris]
MSLSIRPFDGTPEQLSDFVMAHWSQQYRDQAILPVWTGDYFAWQLPALLTDDRSLILAGYDGDRLIAVFPMEDTPIRLQGKPYNASTGSWYTVDPAYQRSGIARDALDALRREHAERDMACMIGFVNAANYPGKGRGFWHSVFPEHVAFDKPILWVLTLNAAATARASPTFMDRVGSHIGGICAWGGRADQSGIRPYTAADKAACHALMTRKMAGFDMAYDWSADRLHHHLTHGPLPRARVLEEKGEITGFVAYHVMDAVGCAPCRMGMVDTLADDGLSARDSRRLLSAAVADMREAGADFAVMLAHPIHQRATLLANGFMPYKSTHKLYAFSTDPSAPVLSARRGYAHYR